MNHLRFPICCRRSFVNETKNSERLPFTERVLLLLELKYRSPFELDIQNPRRHKLNGFLPFQDLLDLNFKIFERSNIQTLKKKYNLIFSYCVILSKIPTYSPCS